MIDGHRNSLLQQHATQDIRLKGLFVQKPSSANQVRQAIAQAHPLTTQVGQVRLFASALNPYLNYINSVYECLYLNTFVHIFSNYCQPFRIRKMKLATEESIRITPVIRKNAHSEYRALLPIQSGRSR